MNEYCLQYKNQFEKKLINQVFYAVCGDINDKKECYTYRGRKNQQYFICTLSEYIEIVAKYYFYKYHWHEDLKIFYKAFLAKNNIYPSQDKVKEIKCEDLTEEDWKILELTKGMDRHEYLLQIENNGGKNNERKNI